jgi:uncharacterized protein
VRIGLISDTHGFLDKTVFAHLATCDEVWHAGDFGSLEILNQLREFKPTRGVYGNVDGADLRAVLPGGVFWDCEGVRVYMTHIGGYPGHYHPVLKKTLTRLQPGLFICGHSHILKVMQDPAFGLLHLNPGACGRHGLHLVRTMLRFTVEGAGISDIETIELGPRSQARSFTSAAAPTKKRTRRSQT